MRKNRVCDPDKMTAAELELDAEMNPPQVPKSRKGRALVALSLFRAYVPNIPTWQLMDELMYALAAGEGFNEEQALFAAFDAWKMISPRVRSAFEVQNYEHF